MGKYRVTIGSFVEQIDSQFKNPDDIIVSIGTWSGHDRQYLYTLHCKEENGNEYDINIVLETEAE